MKTEHPAEQAIMDWVRNGVQLEATRLENELRLKIQPRPRWLPERLWHKVLARVLYLEERNLKFP